MSAAPPQVTPQVTPQVKRLLAILEGEVNREWLMQRLHLRDRQSFRKAYLLPALSAGLIEMTIPEKPQSSQQRYRLTPLGRRVLGQPS